MASTADDSTMASMIAACSSGNLPALRKLFRLEPLGESDESIFTLLEEATKHNNVDIVKYLLQQSTRNDFTEPVIWAAVWSGQEIYELYFQRNPDIIKQQWKEASGDAVCIAIVRNDTKLLTYLLEHGGDPGRSLESPKHFLSFLPLEFVAFSSTETNARLLIEHGATLKHTGALQLAARSRRRERLDMVRLLVEAGIDVNGMVYEDDTSADQQYLVNPAARETALHSAARNGYKDVVEYLLEHGADPEKKNVSGHTAVDCASNERYDEIVCLLQSKISEKAEEGSHILQS